VEAIGHILPIALAVAVSSVPIMATLFILLSPNRSRAALPFLIGWVVGLFIVITVCALAAQLVPSPRFGRRPDTVVGVLEIVVGLALVGVGIYTLRRARHSAEAARTQSTSKRTIGPWQALGLGLILNLRPKALLLAIAGGLTIRGDAGSTAEAVFVIVVYTVIGSSTVVVPIVGTLVNPTKMEPRLTSAREWLIRNGDVLTGFILIMIGVVVLGMGIARL
jgi:hypothetical protein